MTTFLREKVMSLTGKTLLLTQGYQPAAIISWQKAVTLVFLYKAEVVREYDNYKIRSAKSSMPMPSVIRLTNKFKWRAKPIKFNRSNVFKRDSHACLYCGKRCNTRDLTFDHVIPRSKDGKTTWENIASACGRCNRKKGGRRPEEAGMRLSSKPYRPTGTYYPFNIKIQKSHAPESWKDFLLL